MRAPLCRRPQPLWPDVVAAFRLLDPARPGPARARAPSRHCRPSHRCRAGTGSLSRPRTRSDRAAAPGSGVLQLDERLFVAGHRLLELVENALLLGDARGELQRILDPHAAVAAMPLGHAEQGFGRRVVEVDRLLVVHVELDQAERVLGPRLLDPMAVLHGRNRCRRASLGSWSRAPCRQCPWARSMSAWRPAGRSAPGAAASACRLRPRRRCGDRRAGRHANNRGMAAAVLTSIRVSGGSRGSQRSRSIAIASWRAR